MRAFGERTVHHVRKDLSVSTQRLSRAPDELKVLHVCTVAIVLVVDASKEEAVKALYAHECAVEMSECETYGLCAKAGILGGMAKGISMK